MKWVFIVFCVYVVSLFFRTERIPHWLIDRVCDRFSDGDRVFVTCEEASFGFRSGLSLSGIRVFDLAYVTDTNAHYRTPALSMEAVNLGCFSRCLKVTGLSYPRLQADYYSGSQAPRPQDGADWEPLDFPDFTFVLKSPKILGIEAGQVTGEVRFSRSAVEVSGIRLEWPDKDRRMELTGFCRVDLERRRVEGEVRGTALQRHIRPLLVALDYPVAFPYFDGFTGVVDPVPSVCQWDVDLDGKALALKLDLKPTLGRYNGVALSHVASDLVIANTNGAYRVTVGPLLAIDPKGRVFGGTLVVRGKGDRCDLDIDAHSNLDKQGTFDIVGYLNDGLLDGVVCETPPRITAQGTIATDVARQGDNDLSGRVDFDRGSILGVPLREVAFDYHYLGDSVVFSNFVARGEQYGAFSGGGRFTFPEFDPERTTFGLRLECRDARFEQLARVLGFDPEDRNGKFDGEIEIMGPTATNLFKRGLCGRGTIKVTEGHLAQMKVFAGLTELMADKVPGVASIVNQHQASADFTITNGVLSTENFRIEGGLFSIKIGGKYDIGADNLDFGILVQFLKKDSLLGKLLHPVTWPFSKLLMEFRVKGTLENPRWEYISILDRVL